MKWGLKNEYFTKSQDAISVLEAESQILMHEIAPHDWTVLWARVEELKSYFAELEAEYSEE